jgi:hypothetical protein
VQGITGISRGNAGKKVVIGGVSRGGAPSNTPAGSALKESKGGQGIDDITDAPYMRQLLTKRIVDKIAVAFDGDSRPIKFQVPVDEAQLSSAIKVKDSAEFPSVYRFPLPPQIDSANHPLRLPLSFNSLPGGSESFSVGSYIGEL